MKICCWLLTVVDENQLHFSLELAHAKFSSRFLLSESNLGPNLTAFHFVLNWLSVSQSFSIQLFTEKMRQQRMKILQLCTSHPPPLTPISFARRRHCFEFFLPLVQAQKKRTCWPCCVQNRAKEITAILLRRRRGHAWTIHGCRSSLSLSWPWRHHFNPILDRTSCDINVQINSPCRHLQNPEWCEEKLANEQVDWALVEVCSYLAPNANTWWTYMGIRQSPDSRRCICLHKLASCDYSANRGNSEAGVLRFLVALRHCSHGLEPHTVCSRLLRAL